MGYACPVCGDPQADGHHLANHLAFTAMLGDGDHVTWLDERVPDWADADPADLAATVTEAAEETDYPQVFGDTSSDHDRHHDHAHGHAGGPADALDGGPGDVDLSASVDDTAERGVGDVLAEARDLTRRRRTDAAGAEGGSGTDDRADESPDANGGTDDS